MDTLLALKEIKAVADDHGVEFWLLGGLAIAFHKGELYRQFSDVDIICRTEDDVKALCDALAKIGYSFIRHKRLTDKVTTTILKKDLVIDIGFFVGEFGMSWDDLDGEKTLDGLSCKVVSIKFLISLKKYFISARNKDKDVFDLGVLNALPSS